MDLQRKLVTPARPGLHWELWLALAGLTACVLWSHWPAIDDLQYVWAHNPEYSVGALVPLVAIYLVWRQRTALARCGVRPSAWGAVVLVLAETLRQTGLYYGIGSAAAYTLIASIVGVVLLAAGWPVVRQLWSVFVFLPLLAPLPARIHEFIAVPLQELAAASAVFLLQLAGFYVLREGQLLRLNESGTVMLAEGCSGLRMLTAFAFVGAVLVFLLDRPRWQKALLLLCSIPIAVACNSVRLVATSTAVYYGYGSATDGRFHDFAGLAMMPLGLALFVALLKLLDWLRAPRTSTGGARRMRVVARQSSVPLRLATSRTGRARAR